MAEPQNLPPLGSLAEYRAFIGETADTAARHAGLAITYAEMGDDRGLTYAVRCLAATATTALETLDELRKAKEVQAARAAAALPPARRSAAG